MYTCHELPTVDTFGVFQAGGQMIVYANLAQPREGGLKC